jgi:hypothetical protein
MWAATSVSPALVQRSALNGEAPCRDLWTTRSIGASVPTLSAPSRSAHPTSRCSAACLKAPENMSGLPSLPKVVLIQRKQVSDPHEEPPFIRRVLWVVGERPWKTLSSPGVPSFWLTPNFALPGPLSSDCRKPAPPFLRRFTWSKPCGSQSIPISQLACSTLSFPAVTRPQYVGGSLTGAYRSYFILGWHIRNFGNGPKRQC